MAKILYGRVSYPKESYKIKYKVFIVMIGIKKISIEIYASNWLLYKLCKIKKVNKISF